MSANLIGSGGKKQVHFLWIFVRK